MTFISYRFVGRVKVFVSLVGGDDQSKCKWVFGKNLNHYNCPFSKHFKNYLGCRKDTGTEGETGLCSTTKFRASLWNMSRDKAASKQQHGSLDGARRSDGSGYSLIFKDTMPDTLVQQVQE